MLEFLIKNMLFRKKKKLVVTDLSQTREYPKLVVSFSMDKFYDKEFKSFFDDLKIEYISYEDIKKGFENGIHFYYKKNKYDLEMIRFSEKSVFLIVRSENHKFQEEFINSLIKHSEYSGPKKELKEMWSQGFFER
jgi:hypothetical protein